MSDWYLDVRLGQFPFVGTLAMMERVKTLGGIVLLRDYDPELHWELKQQFPTVNVVSMFDWLCGTHTMSDNHLIDMRMNNIVNKRFNVVEIADGKSGSNLIYRGQKVGHITTGQAGQLLTIGYDDLDGRETVKEWYDTRGFKSRAIYYDLEGNPGHELYYRPDGSVAIEVDHMQVNGQPVTSYWTNGRWFSNLNELTHWWLATVLRSGDRLFVENQYLSGGLGQLSTKNYLVIHDPVDKIWPNFVKPYLPAYQAVITNVQGDLKSFQQVVSRAQYLPEIVPRRELPTAMDITSSDLGRTKSEKVVTAFGLLINQEYVRRLADTWNQAIVKHPDWRLHLLGYFETKCQKEFFSALTGAARDTVTQFGHRTGKQQAAILSQSDVIWWMNSGHNTSNFGPDTIAQYEIPGIGQMCDSNLYTVVKKNPQRMIKATEDVINGAHTDKLKRLKEDEQRRFKEIVDAWKRV